MHNRWNGPTVAMIDMLLSLVVIFAALSLLAPKPAPPQAATLGDKPICMMAIDIEWDGKLTSDIDLWVKAPGDEKSIGFANAHNLYVDLVRDDLGGLVDLTGKHSERTCVRAALDGSYTVAVDLFRHATEDALPIPVHVRVSFVDPSTAIMRVIYEGDISITATREEVTAVNFAIKGNALVADSINYIPTPIRGYQ